MSLKGTLQDMPLVDLLYVFRAEEKSGVLFLVDETQRAVCTSVEAGLSMHG
ncbi:MAG: hypothetical protein HC876_02230 [Chloroflexaceae bacterium]|nr:hypothetical protein [Chloroflexaceae bacterium]